MALSAKLCWENDHTQRNGDPSITAAEEDKRPSSVFHCFPSSQWKTAIEKINLESLWPKLQDDLPSSCTTTFPISFHISMVFKNHFWESFTDMAFIYWSLASNCGHSEFRKIGFAPYLLISHSIYIPQNRICMVSFALVFVFLHWYNMFVLKFMWYWKLPKISMYLVIPLPIQNLVPKNQCNPH